MLPGFRPPFSWLVTRGEADWRIQKANGGTDVVWRYTFTLTTPLVYPLGVPSGFHAPGHAALPRGHSRSAGRGRLESVISVAVESLILLALGPVFLAFIA